MTAQLQPNPPIIKRRAAHEAGLSRYYTGRPCIHGHDSQRWVVSGICIMCARKASRQFAAVRDGRLNLITVTVTVHPDDAGQIRDLAAAMNAGRDAAIAAKIFDVEAERRRLFPQAYGVDDRTAPGSQPHGRQND